MKVISLFILIFILLLIYLGQAFWIYIDSSKRNVSFGWIWMILALISFPVPLIIYFLISRNGMKKCTNCGKLTDNSLTICPYCGNNSNQTCKNCGHIIESNWNFCPNCNEKLK